MTDARPSKRLPAAAWLGLAVLLIISSPAPAFSRANNTSASEAVAVTDPSRCITPHKQKPKKYRGRYARWKATFLSADIGRQLWIRYACNPAFRLTIIISDDMNIDRKSVV